MNSVFDLEKYARKARQAVAEGCVLLQNNNSTLPLEKGVKLAVFGRSQFHYYKSGTGSGGLVNTESVPTVLDVIEQNSFAEINKDLKAVYENWLKDHPFDAGNGWATEPWHQEEMPLTAELVEKAAENSDTALVIISRTAGEDKDNAAVGGSYLLADDETEMLRLVCRHFDKTIVLLNTGNVIDMKWVGKFNPDSVLYIWQGGQEGSRAAVDVLFGISAPSGKLPDTIALNAEDYPANSNYGDKDCNIYEEDIYVGYRYFETFAPQKVMYPFGFGLTYTDFTVLFKSAEIRDNTVYITADVKNIGSRSGKQVLQVYCEAPQGKLGKPVRVLCGFIKTKELEPDELQRVTIECSFHSFASYDDSGVTGNKSCFLLEEGMYRFYLGTDVRMAECVFEQNIPHTVLEKLSERLAPCKKFNRLRPGARNKNGVYEIEKESAPQRTQTPIQHRDKNIPETIEQTGDMGWKLADVADGRVSMSEFIAQLSDEDLCCIIRGEGMCSPKVTPGTEGAFGGITDSLLHFGIPIGCCADGPSGIRLDCGTIAFSMPNGTCLAASFNPELSYELYEFEGLELRKNKIDALLGPGMNLHRHILNGRNFEYFSEDPLLTGKITAAQLQGMHKYGVTGTIKHFACNNQEFRRNYVEGVISERALRELYLKGFEIAVKEGGAFTIMSTYGPVNGLWTASNYDLLTGILRDEWGFDGIVMTDWWAKGNDEGMPASRQNTAAMVRSQNDLYMVTGNAEKNSMHDNSAEAIADGRTTRGEYQRAAMNICNALMRLPAFARMRGEETELDRQLAECETKSVITSNEIHYITVDPDGTDLDVSMIKTEKSSDTQFGLTFKERGKYSIRFVVRSCSELPLAQLSLSVFSGKSLIGTVSLTGADTDWTEKIIELPPAFETNMYLRFFCLHDGLEIKQCHMKLEQSVEQEILNRIILQQE